jgi:hypothetical protein
MKIFRIFANVLALISISFFTVVSGTYSLLSIFEGDYIFGALIMLLYVAMCTIIIDVMSKIKEK